MYAIPIAIGSATVALPTLQMLPSLLESPTALQVTCSAILPPNQGGEVQTNLIGQGGWDKQCCSPSRSTNMCLRDAKILCK